ncbi:MAG TPA: GNAT family N-acetyltransferase [Gammaproteobacteria bacterium]|nr:GNAT family N-acetyltransferase [Gammaproteobacteria bacterium]
MKDRTCKDITIREANNSDSTHILDLIFKIWVDEYHFDVKKEHFPDLHEIEKYYSKEDGIFLVSIIGNQIVGTIACNRLTHHSFVLKRMFVDKNYRRLGIAQMLLNNLFSLMIGSIEFDKVSFYLSTKEIDAISAKKFYIKNGFRVIQKSMLPDNFPFFYKDDLFMMKDSDFLP